MWFWKRANISGVEARQLVASGARLVDVRSRAEFAGGALPGAINVPVDSLSARLKELGPRGSTLVVYCLSGSRSALAKRVLEKNGFTSVRDLGAMKSW
jgi:phage shock protein E